MLLALIAARCAQAAPDSRVTAASGRAAALQRRGTRPPPISPPARTSPAIAPGISRRRGAPARSSRSTIIWRPYQVGGIVPTWQLLRTATSWQDCGGQPFEVPPTDEWPHIVQTLRYVHDYVDSRGRPGRAGVGLSQPALNHCAGGAPESAHKHYSAIDLVPLRPIDREDADADLVRDPFASTARRTTPGSASTPSCASTSTAPSSGAGTWTRRSRRECPPIVHPEDIATVGQPLPRRHGRRRHGPRRRRSRLDIAASCRRRRSRPQRRASSSSTARPCVAHVQHHIARNEEGY